MWAIVVVAAHCVVILRHRCLIRECLLFKSLGNGILGDPKLFHVFVVPRKIVGRHGNLVLAFDRAYRHAHCLTRGQIRHPEGTPERGGRSSPFHWEAVIVARFVPPRGSQRTLTVQTGGSRSWRLQWGEARSHRGTFTGSQGVTVDLNSQAIRNLLALSSHFVDVFVLDISWSKRVDNSIACVTICFSPLIVVEYNAVQLNEC